MAGKRAASHFFNIMKKVFRFMFAISLLAVQASCSSTTGDEPDPEPIEPGVTEEVMVRIGYSVDVSQESLVPQGRAGEGGNSNDLIGVSIFHISKAEEGHTSEFQYAYGVFDDVNAMVFKLNKGQRYRVNMIYYHNAKNIVWRNGNGTYGRPFNDPYLSSPAYRLNEPVYYSEGTFVYNIFHNYYQNSSAGYSDCAIDANCVRGTTPIYMGLRELTIDSDKDIDIQLASCIMGIKLNCSNFTEGRLTLEYDYHGSREVSFAPGDVTADYVQITCPYEQTEDFSGFGNIYHSGNDLIRLYYENSANKRYLLATKNLEWKANTSFVFTFNLEERSDGSFGILMPSADTIVDEDTTFD